MKIEPNQIPVGNAAIYSRKEISSFFISKYLRLLRAALNRDEQRLDYTIPSVREKIVTPYKEMSALGLPQQSGVTHSPTVPRHIWMLWQQGWDSAPPLVSACARSWKEHNPGWELHLLDEKTIAQFAPNYLKIDAPKASRTAKANIARLCLLEKNGGVWADASLFCHQPLDNWLPKVMNAGFFMFAHPRPYRFSEIWFIAGASQSPLITAWLDLVANYWHLFRRPHHYYWMEYLFEYLAMRDSEIMKIWREVPKLSANGPHILGAHPFNAAMLPVISSLLKERTIPVHKLSHKWRYKKPLAGTAAGLLTGLDYL